MRRRDFLLGSSAITALGVTAGLRERLAYAAEKADRYFVFCYFEGGWDHLLGLDPRDPKEFPDDAAAETGIEPGYGRLPLEFSRAPVTADALSFGPCAAALAPLVGHLSLVRGINMATLTHEVGRRYFITGRPPSGLKARGASVAALATAQLGGAEPVPHLAHLVESYAEGLPSYSAALTVASVQHIRYILQETLGIPTGIRSSVKDAVAAFWADQTANPSGAAGKEAAALYRENRARAHALVKQGLHQQFTFDSELLAPVRSHYGFLPTPAGIETASGRAALASQALKSGLSRVVSVALSTQLDTHGQEWAATHSQNLVLGFDALARLLTDLRDTEAPGGGSWLSRTTLVCFSEFGRTARLNERNGRDHSLTNCALLAGAGIQPGRIVGASSDNGMAPELIDLATGEIGTTGTSLRPEHVLTTVLSAAGLDSADLRSEPIATLLA